MRPAVLNDSSLESTSWYEPSYRHDPEVYDRETGKVAALRRFNDSLFDCRNKVLRNRAAEDLVDELEVASAR